MKSYVPVQYRGVWQRMLLKEVQGEDLTSLVFWVQTADLHGDIRIPAGRPDFGGAMALDDLADDQLLWLARQQGFAGVTTISGDVCCWQREVDYQPENGQRDIGRMVFNSPDTLVEHGVESEYLEIWQRLPQSGVHQAGWRTTATHEGQVVPAYLVTAGPWFMYLRSRPGILPPAGTLLMAMQERRPSRATLLAWLDFEISFGRVSPDGQWVIVHSTLPFREGAMLGDGVVSLASS